MRATGVRGSARDACRPPLQGNGATPGDRRTHHSAAMNCAQMAIMPTNNATEVSAAASSTTARTIESLPRTEKEHCSLFVRKSQERRFRIPVRESTAAGFTAAIGGGISSRQRTRLNVQRSGLRPAAGAFETGKKLSGLVDFHPGRLDMISRVFQMPVGILNHPSGVGEHLFVGGGKHSTQFTTARGRKFH